MSEKIKQERALCGQKATQQQRKASNPLKSVWVQASAGTGKTKVLSDRVLRILLHEENPRPERILCLTYTKAAAVEMNQRISKKLSEWAVMEQDKLVAELKDLLGELPIKDRDLQTLEARARRLFAILLDTPGGMKIQTIHSFCQEILKRFPLESHISPYFEVMDDRTMAEALDDIRRQMLQEVETNPNSSLGQSLAYLIACVSEFSFPKILQAIAESRNKIIALFNKYKTPEAVVDELSGRIGVDILLTEEQLMKKFAEEVDFDVLYKIMEAWRYGAEKGASVTDKVKADKMTFILESRDVVGNFNKYKSCFLSTKNEAFADKNMATKKAVSIYPEMISVCKAEALRLEDLMKKIAALRLLQATKSVVYLARELIERYNQFKQLHSKLDYEDLIVLTRNLLDTPQVPQWVMFKLDGGIDNILIDEAQDTSPNQWAIIKALTSGFFEDIGSGNKARTVFAVGDKKQSIYSFQGAEPKEFERMRRYFADMLEENDVFDTVNLEVSFRSTAAVLNTVNAVFTDDVAKKGVVTDDEDITHLPYRIGDAGKIEFWPVVEPIKEEKSNEFKLPTERAITETSQARLAKAIAQKIYDMVENKEELISQKRPLRYKDFMILVQRRNSFVEDVVRACKNVGVSIAGVDKIKLSEQIAVQDLISLGRFLLLPSDDLSLAEVLKSPLFGLDDDDLINICCERGGKTVWNSLANNPQYSDVYKVLQDLCNLAEKVRPFELYAYVLNKLKGRQKFVARLGYEVEDGLDEFVNLTLNFEQEHIPDLQGFIEWMLGDDVEIKRELEQSEADAVRLMTVHGSKGLQAPVVILPDLVRVPKINNEAKMLWDDVFFYPLCSDDYNDECLKIRSKEREEAMEEYRRLLYVALTRAEDRLCLCGYYNGEKSKPKDESWYKICEKIMKEIGQENDAGIIEFAFEQQIEPKVKDDAKNLVECGLPDWEWIYTDAPMEGALAKPLAPSKMDEEEPSLFSPLSGGGENRYRRGLIIHKLLQFLPEVKEQDKENIIMEFLAKNAASVSDIEKKRICDEVLGLINNPQFAPLFSVVSKAEVPIIGEVEGKIISGQVDRLVLLDDEVMIVDYKTNRPAAETLNDVPSSYIKQMKAYQILLAKVYPDKKISTHILWTDTAHLMKIA